MSANDSSTMMLVSVASCCVCLSVLAIVLTIAWSQGWLDDLKSKLGFEESDDDDDTTTTTTGTTAPAASSSSSSSSSSAAAATAEKPLVPDTAGSRLASTSAKKGTSNLKNVFTKAEWTRIAGAVVDTHVKPASAKPYYAYENFVAAAEHYPEFASGDKTIARREIAAFLANMYQEVRFVYTQEIACIAPKVCNNYGNTSWGARKNTLAVAGCTRPESECRYYGRGPIQLTWYLNYLDTSHAVFGDDRLVKQPWLLNEDPKIGWRVAIHFWMKNTGREKMTCHVAIRDDADFGKTISIINGNQECGSSWGSKPQTRLDKYKEYCGILGVPPGNKLKC